MAIAGSLQQAQVERYRRPRRMPPPPRRRDSSLPRLKTSSLTRRRVIPCPSG